MDYKAKYNKWVESSLIDDQTKEELRSLQQDETEVEDRFYRELEFGTGGLRGIMGAGTNRVNVYTIRKATQGLAQYLLHAGHSGAGNGTRSAAIAYDSRHYSDVYALEAALVLAANNIKVSIFDALRPTPELSFAVRHLACDAGIVITASHNPPQYNGYKVYGPDGGQITLETAGAIEAEIHQVDLFGDVKTCSLDEAVGKGLLTFVGKEIDQVYLNLVTGLSLNPQVSKELKDFSIVYTPLHGAGLMTVTRAFSLLGYENVHIVESQKEPDGAFPTVKSPNPEDREALAEGIALAERTNADVVLGTDPDVDRVGVAVRNREGEYVLLTGNQVGALLTHYIVSNKKNITPRDAVVKTIVTSDLGAKIARSYGATVFETLTGFKFIGEKIKDFEEQQDHDFLFGYEESYGYLAGTFVRDKDAVISSVLITEMAAVYRLKGMTLLDALEEIYKAHGYYADALESYTFNGMEGQEKIRRTVDGFRDLEKLRQGFPGVELVEDFQSQRRHTIQTATVETIALPSANVLKVYLQDEAWFAVRPSGTEPKLKIYFSTRGHDASTAKEKLKSLMQQVAAYMS